MRIHFFTAPFFRRQSLNFAYDGEEAAAGSGVYSCCRPRKKSMLLSKHAFYFANIIHLFR